MDLRSRKVTVQKRDAPKTDQEMVPKKRKKVIEKSTPAPDRDHDHDHGDTSSKIKSLPDEILIEIIKLVPVTQWDYLETVSDQFPDAVSEAWQNLKKNRVDEEDEDEELVDEAKKTKKCLQIDLLTICRNWNEDKNQQLLKTIATSENLSSLKISRSADRFEWSYEIKSEFAEMVVELGRRRCLEEFHLLDDCVCSDDIILAVADYMPYLKSLEMCLSDKNRKAAFLRLVRNLKELEILHLWQLSGDIVDDETISAIANHMPDLICLHLYYLGGEQPKSLKDLASLNNLKELCIKSDMEVDTQTMEAWAQGFGSKLEVLSFWGRMKTTNEGLIAIVDKATSLQQLSAGETPMTDHHLLAMAASCPDLRQLEFGFSLLVTSDGMQAIIEGCPRFKSNQGDSLGDSE